LALHVLSITHWELKPAYGSRPTLLSRWHCSAMRRSKVSQLSRRGRQSSLDFATRLIGRSTLPRTWASHLAFACAPNGSPISIMTADMFLPTVAWRNRPGQADHQCPNICLSQDTPPKAAGQGSKAPRQRRGRCPCWSSFHWAASCRTTRYLGKA